MPPSLEGGIVLIQFHFITVVFKLIQYRLAVGLAADLTGDVHLRLVGVEARGELVVLDGEDVGPAPGQNVQHLHEAARLVQQFGRKSDAAMAGRHALLDDALHSLPFRTAATGVAPAGSTIILQRSISSRMASAIWVSDTVTTPSQ